MTRAPTWKSRLPPLIQQFFQRDARPLVQFIKYGIAGVVATVVDMVLFFFLAWKVFPALQSDELIIKGLVHLFDFTVPAVEESVRSKNYLIIKALVFIVSNFIAYVLNFLWVFEPGRHSKKKEVILFYVVSTVSYVLGSGVGWALIKFYGLTITIAYVVNMVVSVMINYVCRKYYVFKG